MNTDLFLFCFEKPSCCLKEKKQQAIVIDELNLSNTYLDRLLNINITVELQWLEHFWDHGNLFETWVVRTTERQVRGHMGII